MSAEGGWRGVAGWLLGFFVRAWIATLRVRLVGVNAVVAGPPAVLAFWHGQQMALCAARFRRTATLVSLSRDGALQAGVMRAMGLCVVRGSSSRGAARGLATLLRLLGGGFHLAFAADGPRGPLHRCKPGAAFAAARASAPLHPVASVARPCLVLGRAWDFFEVPLPFARVVVVAGSPVDARAALADPELLGRAIDAARRSAEDAMPAKMRGSMCDDQPCA